MPAVTKYDPFSAKLIAFTFVDTLLLATCKVGRMRKKKVKVVKILDIWIKTWLGVICHVKKFSIKG